MFGGQQEAGLQRTVQKWRFNGCTTHTLRVHVHCYAALMHCTVLRQWIQALDAAAAFHDALYCAVCNHLVHINMHCTVLK
jgi:hypothetical protein